ncbi:MAG: PIN domain-containing protein [Actinomycetota bacterium]
MTHELPIVYLIFDLGALMAGNTQIWREYGKVGSCYVPEVVFEEIDFLAQRAPEPAQEKVAREFQRFFPESGWQRTDAQETHPAIEPGRAANQSKYTRLVVATAHCVYGFAQENPQALVVFISNGQPLLKRMQALQATNLCGITTAMLLQWVRKGERPIWVSEQLQKMIESLSLSAIRSFSQLRVHTHSVTTGHSLSPEAQVAQVEREITAASRGKPAIANAGSSSLLRSLTVQKPVAASHPVHKVTPTTSHSVSSRSHGVRPRRQEEERYDSIQVRRRTYQEPKGPNIINHLINALMALFFLSIAVGLVWRALSPASFKKEILPKLPQQVRPYLK